MHFDDLRQYIEAADQLGELQRVEGAHWNLEIGAITELMAEGKGTALLFDNIVDYPPGYRILTNAMLSLKRTALVLGLPQNLGSLGMLNAWRQKLSVLKPIPPVESKGGPVKQNIHTGDEVNLLEFPAPKWHEPDGGRYLGTASAVITKDPEEGWVNVATYRCMIYDKNTIGVGLRKGKHGRIIMDKYHAQGKPCPIAIAFGQDPALWLAASDPGVPLGMSEYDFAGGIRGRPIEVTRGPVTDLPLPATAEIVIEGEIPPLEQIEPRPEGPFGEWTGYFADSRLVERLVMTVKSVLHRDNPIILGAPPLKPPAWTRCAIPLTSAHIWDQIEKAGILGVRGVWQLVFEYPVVVVVAIRQMYPGHAMQAATAAISCGASMLNSRFVIVVDDDVDITSPEEIFWVLGSRSKPEDFNLLKDFRTAYADPTLDDDKRQREEVTGCRMIINACRPYINMKDFPPVNVVSPEYRQKVQKKWQKLLAK